MAARFDFVYWFSEIDKNDSALVGSIGASLGDMTSAGLPVPNGFIISSRAYTNFLRENNLAQKITHLLATVNYDQHSSVQQVSQHIKKLILESGQSKTLVDEITSSYAQLGGLLKHATVTILPSATTQDVHTQPCRNIKGDTSVLLTIKKGWATLFDPQAILYRHAHHSDHFRIGIAMVVQEMIAAEQSGILYTVDPVSNDKTKMIIQAVYGSDELLVEGDILPDQYEIQKSDGTIINKQIRTQDRYVEKVANETKEISLPAEQRNKQKITDKQILALADLGKKIEHHFYFPREIKWAIANNKIYIIQTNEISQPAHAEEIKENNPTITIPTWERQTPIKTVTLVYVNFADPMLAKEIAQQRVDGVGLLQAEEMMKAIGVHPKHMLHEGKKNEFIQKLAEQIEMACKPFHPRPVLYRTSDFKTNEYRSLVDGREYEPIEQNPLLGYRGAFRTVHDPEIFELELEAIKIVRNKKGLKNLWLMLPFIRSVRELIDMKRIIASMGLYRSPSFKIYMMCEIPSNVLLLDKYIQVGIDGVSIGANDLTTLMLGVDRDNSEVAQSYDEQNEAVLWAFEKVITTCKEHAIAVSICEHAPHLAPDLLEKLVKWGITSVSVSPHLVDSVREHIARFEKDI